MEQIHWCIVPLDVAIFLWFAPKTMLVSCPKEVQLLKAVNAKSWGLNKPAVCWPRIYWLRPGNLRHKQSLGRSFILISKFSWPEGKCMECQRAIWHYWIEEANYPHAASTVSCRIRRRKHHSLEVHIASTFSPKFLKFNSPSESRSFRRWSQMCNFGYKFLI